MEFNFSKAEAELIQATLRQADYTDTDDKVTASWVLLKIKDKLRYEPGPAVARPGW